MSLESIDKFVLMQYFGAFICGACLLVIGVKNPIHSILLLMSVFCLGSLLLFFLSSEYYASLFLVVYVGAIVVLFLFIVSSLEIKSVNFISSFQDLFAIRHLVLAFLALEVFFLFSQDSFTFGFSISMYDLELRWMRRLKWCYEHLYEEQLFYDVTAFTFFAEAISYLDSVKLIQHTDQLHALGGLLYTENKMTVLLASLLLFVSSVGALAVTVNLPTKLTPIKSQDANLQASQNPSRAINLHSTSLSLLVI